MFAAFPSSDEGIGRASPSFQRVDVVSAQDDDLLLDLGRVSQGRVYAAIQGDWKLLDADERELWLRVFIGGLSVRPTATVFVQCVKATRRKSGVMRLDVHFDHATAVAELERVDGTFVRIPATEALLADAVATGLRFVFWVLTADGSMACVGTLMLFERPEGVASPETPASANEHVSRWYAPADSDDVSSGPTEQRASSEEGERDVFEDACGADASAPASLSGFHASMFYRGCSRCNPDKAEHSLLPLGVGEVEFEIVCEGAVDDRNGEFCRVAYVTGHEALGVQVHQYAAPPGSRVTLRLVQNTRLAAGRGTGGTEGLQMVRFQGGVAVGYQAVAFPGAYEVSFRMPRETAAAYLPQDEMGGCGGAEGVVEWGFVWCADVSSTRAELDDAAADAMAHELHRTGASKARLVLVAV